MNKWIRSMPALALLLGMNTVLADSNDEKMLLRCAPEEDKVFHIAFHEKDKAKLILSTGAVDGWMTTSENFYTLEFPGNNQRPTSVVTVNRLSGLFTMESGSPPFGAGNESNTVRNGECKQATRDRSL